MPRTIDSLSPKPEDQKPKPVAEHKAGEVYRPAGSGPRAGEVVKPAGKQLVVDTPVIQANTPGGAKTRPRRSLNTSTKIVLGVGVLLVLGGIGYLIYHSSSYKKTADIVAAAKKDSVSAEEAKKKLDEINKKKNIADKLQIRPSQTSLDFIARRLTHDQSYNDLDAWKKALVEGEALDAAAQTATQGGYDVTIFYFPFTYHQESLGYAFKDNTPQGYRDPVVIEQDRKYAEEQADRYHTQLDSGTSQATVLSAVVADPKLQYAGSPNNSRSFVASPQANGTEEVITSAVSRVYNTQDFDASKLNKQASVGLSAIKTGKIKLYDKPGEPQVDGYYYYYVINSYAEPRPDVQNEYTKQLQAAGVSHS